MKSKKDDIEEVEVDMRRPASKEEVSDKFWHDKNGNLAIFQKPNKFIVAWFITFILSEIIFTQPIKSILSWTAFGLLMIWAVLEIKYGASYFRKTLGVLVFLLAILTRF